MFGSFDFLLSHSLFPLILISSLGLLAQKLPYIGKALGPSAVVFAALIMGVLGAKVPVSFTNFGIVLFLFSIGVQAGPSFFSTFKSDGKELFFISFSIISTALLIAVACVKFLHLDLGFVLGLVNGALTSTPGLATISETLSSPQTLIGYSLAYPFGVFGVILFVRLLPKLLKEDLDLLDQEFYAKKKRAGHELKAKFFCVKNPNLDQKLLCELDEEGMLNASISRLTHNGHTVVPTKEARLSIGDTIKVVATEEHLARLSLIVGPEVCEIKELDPIYDVKQFVVSNAEIINKTLSELNLLTRFNARVTRIQRNAVDFYPRGKNKLKMGDKLTIAYDGRFYSNLSDLFGNRPNSMSDDYLALFVGIFVGILLSQIKFTLPHGIHFELGLAGGVLFSAIILSYFGKIGPVVFHLSTQTNKVIRELGLILFFAGVGTKAGEGFAHIDLSTGVLGIGIGALMTLLPMVLCAIILRIFKSNLLKILGIITGGMTSTPALASLSSVTNSSVPALFYASVYPFALVQLIIGLKFILFFLE